MVIQRDAYKSLLDWKMSTNRQPLLIRGARQVGKTTLVRAFASEFACFLELNLEKEADRNLFQIDDVEKILSAAYLLKGISPENKPTLLFIDEIQESPKAIRQLRYFYEEKPELFVIAAGSLLEFSFNKVPSFPVGRIEYLYLYPVNFSEFLGALGNHQALKLIDEVPVPDYAHQIILDLFHDYAIIGGMPELVSQYVEEKNMAALSKTYNKLWQAYKDDVEKYAKNSTERTIIRHIFETAPAERDRIKFEGFGHSNFRSREVGEAFRALDMAKIIQLIYPSTSVTPPVVTDFKKRPRLQFLDTGLLNHILNFQGEMIGLNDLSNFFKGKIIQHLVCQELISIHKDIAYKPHFWVREEKNRNSEVDMVYNYKKYVIPIEVKSGKQGRLRSLHQFVERTNHPYAVRIFAGEFSVEKAVTPSGTKYYLMNIPYYLGTKIPEYLSYLVKNYH